MNDLDGKTLKLRDDLTLAFVEDSGALLDVQKRCYFDLNSTAFFIASMLENGYQYDEIPSALTSEFSVDAKTATLDMDNFIDELLRHGLVIISEDSANSKEVSDIQHGIKPYQAPVIEYNSELAVACAPTGQT